jgi:hypothetical protein
MKKSVLFPPRGRNLDSSLAGASSEPSSITDCHAYVNLYTPAFVSRKHHLNQSTPFSAPADNIVYLFLPYWHAGSSISPSHTTGTGGSNCLLTRWSAGCDRQASHSFNYIHIGNYLSNSVKLLSPCNCKLKSKAIPVTGRGGPHVCFLRGTNIIYIIKKESNPRRGGP